jgi:hypothetical protein
MLDKPDLLGNSAARPVGRVAAWLVALLYVASVALPASGGLFGLVCFVGGAFASLIVLPASLVNLLGSLPGSLLGDAPFRGLSARDLGMFVPWLANPALWVGMIALFRGRPRRAAAAGAVALPLALAFLLAKDSGDHLQAGYYAWAGSMVLLPVAGLAGALTGGGPVRLQDAAPKFGESEPLRGQGSGIQRPADTLQPPP